MCKYRFSPSLMDKFSRYLMSEADFESDFNYTDEGGYKKTLEEIIAEREQEMLDSINGVPQEPTEAAARGTAFNEVVDEMMQYLDESVIDLAKIQDPTGRVKVTDLTEDSVTATCDGFTFTFDRALVEAVAIAMEGATTQRHIQCKIETEMGDVLVHGYPDYILQTSVTDLKTTESYTFGKYEHYSQRYVYPYILYRTGLLERIDWFEFLVVEMKKDKETGIISGTIGHETYTDVANYDKCKEEVAWLCNGLAQWVEEHRHLITNNKVFNFQ